MKSTPLIVNWHNENAPIYSAHFQPDGSRLATAGGDNNVRLWKIEKEGEDRNVEYLSTLSKHTQAVNVVRFAPKGETLASAGDDGVVLLWIPHDHVAAPALAADDFEDKETWRVKHIMRSSGAEIYDLAWSPDAVFFIIGSMDNVARIYNAQNGQLVRHIAEHNHYVQGVAWDPLNEYIATQSSDRSVHIYALRTKDGQFTLDQQSTSSQTQHNKVAAHVKMDLPGRRISSPVPPDVSFRSLSNSQLGDVNGLGAASPAPSAPGTPNTFALPMNPPTVSVSHSRRSSFGSSPSMRRSASPAPSMPLPAVKPMELPSSPRPYFTTQTVKNGHLYHSDVMSSFFRRLTFTPDGSLLFTPAGQYQMQSQDLIDPGKIHTGVINTVYVYPRGGINKPPLAHLPKTKKPSVAVKCSPVYYTLRNGCKTKHISIDTSCKESSDGLSSLPEPAVASSSKSTEPEIPTTAGGSVMEPPPHLPMTADPSGPTSSPRKASTFSEAASRNPKLEIPVSSSWSEKQVSDRGPPSAIAMPYRMVYAVATQDSVILYDTQQQTAIAVVSNLHYAAFTDLTWSNDGLTLLMTSSDGFCSTLTFEPGELGSVYNGPVGPPQSGSSTLSASTGPFTSTTGIGLGLERPGSSAQSTPLQTPISAAAGSASPFTSHGHSNSFTGWSGIGHQRNGSNASISSTSLSHVMGPGGFSTPAPTPAAIAASSPTTLPGQSQTPQIYQPTPISSSHPNASFVTTAPGLANSLSSYGRASSPTRSNSTSSIATQATGFGIGASSSNSGIRESMNRDRDTIISNPTLMGGSVPAVGYGVGFGATPPQTPRSMASSEVGVKREAGDGTESESDVKGDGPRKKRRIAPTLVGDDDALSKP